MRLCQNPVLHAVFLIGAVVTGGGGEWAAAQAPAPAAAPAVSADELLRRVDKEATAFNDAIFHFKMRIKEPGGQVREVEFTNMQKGNQKRIVRFLSPGDIKGMGILVESADSMYALLPAFGNRIRRVSTSQKSQSFMGSDLGYEDMSAIEFGSVFNAKLAGTEGDQTILELTPRPGKQTEFPRMKMWMDAKIGTVYKIEYYDGAGKKARTQVRSEFQLDPGTQHHSPHKLTFIDHRRNNHETELILLDSKLNTGIPDDAFSQRALQRN